jgi:hypothetical protein
MVYLATLSPVVADCVEELRVNDREREGERERERERQEKQPRQRYRIATG